MMSIEERQRTVPVVESTDIVICGAGPAGIAAAISAARAGAKVRLLEVQGCLGGVWTAGLLSYVIDAKKPDGLLPELVARLQECDAYQKRAVGSFLFDPEAMKLLLEELCMEAGVSIQYHTRVTSAHLNAGQRLEAVVTESKSGRQAWRAKVFIDCSGDGDLGALAGCDFELGRAEDGAVQPMSLLALVAGVPPEEIARFHDVRLSGRSAALLEELARGGFHPSYESPSLFYLRDDLYAMMVNHEYGVSATDAQAVTEATIRARREVNSAVKALRSLGGCWSNLRVVATAAQIGIREGRRLCGREKVTMEDLVIGRERSDSVCRASFSMDVHSPDPTYSRGFDFRGRKPVLPYDIPYGALVARGVNGLLMAGRCISGDFFAHASYRVTGNAVAMGEAAGRAAAHCALEDKMPHEICWPLPSAPRSEEMNRPG